MTIKKIMRRAYWFSTQFGFDPRMMFRSLRGIPRYLHNLISFKSGYVGRLAIRPCLHDWYEEGGSVRHEYFWQDLHVARKIFLAKPEKHVDIGSRIDGFVAHVASFREIEVFDIRPLDANIPGVIFKQADLMSSSDAIANYCDSLSCLHALEHFGLGRYGDPLDPSGYEAGIRQMSRVIRLNGLFYLSVPVGLARVEFNAHRVFEPNMIVKIAKENALHLVEFALFTADSGLVEIAPTPDILASVGQLHYALGIFTFKKI